MLRLDVYLTPLHRSFFVPKFNLKLWEMSTVFEQRDWHTLKIEEIEKLLGTDRNRGLNSSEAKRRLGELGPNELEEKKKTGPVLLFLSQFNDFMIYVLIAATIISGLVLKETVDALAILAILILNSILGFVQEARAERALEALKRLAAPTARVIRSEKELEVSAGELVPGDVVILEPGDHIPADVRVVECAVFATDESSLTGESGAVHKHTHPLSKPDVPLGERTNMGYMGTTIASGRARAIVVSTGKSTEMGQIAEIIQAEREKTPLQIELKRVGKKIAVLCLLVCAVVFACGVLKGEDWTLMFLAGVSLAVAAIPEGLPAIVTVTLAIGVQNMARRNAIVRKLHAVETLGCTTAICSDKTGTLTRNQMTVKPILLKRGFLELNNEGSMELRREGQPPLEDIEFSLKIAALCNDARRTQDGQLVGDPTETALLKAAELFGFPKGDLEEEAPRLNEIPFDPERKLMTTIHELTAVRWPLETKYVALVKGAPEMVLERCSGIYSGWKIQPLAREEKENILHENEVLARKGYRTLGLAYKPLEKPPAEARAEEMESDLVFVGLMGMTDPPRPEVYEAIKLCQDARIKVAMVTGDHKLTAETIAREIGLIDRGEAITGLELERMSEEELTARVEDIVVYARVDPKDKLKIIKALKNRGHIVGMTGDGINDAPAVKMADIGIAMGVVGTDVTKEASDMILADDNFATIVAAIRQGRVIFGNIKKSILFLLSCNASEVLVMFLGMISLGILPLLPIQILWINLVTDGLPALALGVDPPPEDLMRRSPRKATEGILSGPRLTQVLWQGALLTLGALFALAVGLLWLKIDLAQARTMTFTAVVLAQLLHALNFRTGKHSVFTPHALANKTLLAAIGVSILLQMTAIHVPILQTIFHAAPLGLREWGVTLVAAVLPLLLMDLIKTMRKCSFA